MSNKFKLMRVYGNRYFATNLGVKNRRLEFFKTSFIKTSFIKTCFNSLSYKAFKAWFIAFAVMGLLSLKFSLLISSSDSLPYHYFLQIKNVPVNKGDYVVVYNDWLKCNVIKQIKGVGGDRLIYDKSGNLWLDEQCIGKPYQSNSQGRTLTPIAAQVIAKGHVFLSATHLQSFDSRYQELGLVSLDLINDRVIPLW